MITNEELQSAKNNYQFRNNKKESVTTMLKYVQNQKDSGKLDALVADELTEMILAL